MELFTNPCLPHGLVLGVSHKTCPVHIRDRLAYTDSALPDGLASLRRLPGLSEALILSTCNRTEIYVMGPCSAELQESVLSWWADDRRMDLGLLRSHSYSLSHEEAVSHLYGVVSSVYSQVLGEYQILGQVRAAFACARECGTVGYFLNRLFQTALAVGKKVREQTSIGEGAVSVAYAAVELCRRELGDLSRCRAGVLGLGDTGILVARSLHDAGVRDFRFFNRTVCKAEIAASQFGGLGLGLDALENELPGLDMLVTCTGSPSCVVTPMHLKGMATGHSLLMMDIAVPRDIDVACAELPGCRLLGMDDLQRIVEGNLEKRKAAMAEAHDLIEQAVEDYKEWYRGLQALPLVTALRGHAEKLKQAELDKWRHRVSAEQIVQMEKLAEGLLGKLLHEPTVQLRKMGAEGLPAEMPALLARLFGWEHADG